MLESIRRFFRTSMPAAGDERADPKDVRLAACALLLELAHADDRFSDEERRHVEGAIRRHMGLDAADADRLLRAVEKAFGDLPRTGAPRPAVPPPTPVRNLSLHLVNRPGSVQTNLLFARPALPRRHPRFATALVANQSLGGGASSRLFHVLREERSLTYGAYSALSPRVSAGHFGAAIDCRTEVTRDALDGLLGLIRDYAAGGPTAEEHARSVKNLLGTFVLGRETPGAILQDEVTRLLHGLPDDEFATWRERVAAVTPPEARDAARDLFDPSIGVLTAVGDAAAIRPVLETLGEVTLWDADGPRP